MMEPFIMFGVGSGILFLLFLMCVVAAICLNKRRSERYRQQYLYTAAPGPNLVSNINAQFNNPTAASGPTFAPAANYPMAPGYQYPANPVSTYMSSPISGPDPPPSYSRVFASS